jgi:NAD+ kinase
MRSALVVAHTNRPETRRMAADAADQLHEAGLEVRMLADEAADCGCGRVSVVDHDGAAEGAEIVLVFGGDGTFLRAAEFARPTGVPMLGVNFGRVGFLAEADPEALTATTTSRNA